jgi:SAM-dependent methyltransferase
MTVLQPRASEDAAPDPFATARRADRPSRPRVLSYVGRWGRARRWLPAHANRVLDVGCAFGYGSAALATSGRRVVGIERDSGNVEAARRLLPELVFLEGDAEALPVPDGCADAVIMLDIVEHLADPRRALAEAHRVLRPSGVIVLSVPNRGALHRFDALNVYTALRRRRPHWPPLEADTESAGDMHRHFTMAEIERLLAPSFRVDRVARTGIGLQEFLYLALLLARVPLRRDRVLRVFLPLHLLVYILDDAVPWGRLGYHLAVRAVRMEDAS